MNISHHGNIACSQALNLNVMEKSAFYTDKNTIHNTILMYHKSLGMYKKKSSMSNTYTYTNKKAIITVPYIERCSSVKIYVRTKICRNFCTTYLRFFHMIS